MEPPQEWAEEDDSSRVATTEDDVVRGQCKPRVILHACPMTNEEVRMLGMKHVQMVAVVRDGRSRGQYRPRGRPGGEGRECESSGVGRMNIR